jgi:hypothetical protein
MREKVNRFAVIRLAALASLWLALLAVIGHSAAGFSMTNDVPQAPMTAKPMTVTTSKPFKSHWPALHRC